MNLDALLDAGFDQLADKPEFKPFPAGVHAVSTFFKNKQFGEKGKDGAGFELKLKYIENSELANPEKDVAPKPDSEMTVNLNLTSEKEGVRNNAQGTLKLVLAAAAVKFPDLKTNRELIEACNGQVALITTTLRPNKQDKDAAGFFQLDKIEFA